MLLGDNFEIVRGEIMFSWEVDIDGKLRLDDLNFYGGMYLSSISAKLRSLPDNLVVSGTLNLSGCRGLSALPRNLTVGGSLYLIDCESLVNLPMGLSVGGNLYLSGCVNLLPNLPDIFQVGRNHYCKDSPWLIRKDEGVLRIGCEIHAVEDWLAFNDNQINQMDHDSLTFWSKYKSVLIDKGLLR